MEFGPVKPQGLYFNFIICLLITWAGTSSQSYLKPRPGFDAAQSFEHQVRLAQTAGDAGYFAALDWVQPFWSRSIERDGGSILLGVYNGEVASALAKADDQDRATCTRGAGQVAAALKTLATLVAAPGGRQGRRFVQLRAGENSLQILKFTIDLACVYMNGKQPTHDAAAFQALINQDEEYRREGVTPLFG